MVIAQTDEIADSDHATKGNTPDIQMHDPISIEGKQSTEAPSEIVNDDRVIENAIALEDKLPEAAAITENV